MGPLRLLSNRPLLWWLTSLHRKQYQHPLTIVCVGWCFDNIIKIKRSFPDKALWNHLLTDCDSAAVWSSTASSFNKCSLWTLHDTVPRLQNKMLRTILRHDAIKNKLSTCSSSRFWYLYKDTNELFKPNASKPTFFHFICPDDRLNLIRMKLKSGSVWSSVL